MTGLSSVADCELDSAALPAPLAGLETPLDALRAAGADFWRRGWSLGTSSNYSVVARREPLELVVTASGLDKGSLARHDFVRVNDQGRPTAADQPKSSAETLLHVLAARRPEVGAVLHTHSVWSTVLSDLHAAEGGLRIEGYEMLKGLAGIATHETSYWLPVFENTQDIPALVREVERRGDEVRHGYLIRKHGLYTWGRDVAEARRQVEIFEFLLECVARRRWLGAG